jgi:HK97 gp10 family phage protein
MAGAVRVLGLNELNATLERAIGESPFLIGNACFAAGHIIADAMEERAPVGTKIHPQTGNKRLGVSWLRKTRYPGNLKRSIVVARSGDSNAIASKPTFKVGPNRGGWYGYYIEHGWDHYVTQEYGTGRVPARPWARPAYDSVSEEAIRAAGEVIRKQLEELNHG